MLHGKVNKGLVIRIAADSKTHINAMDMDANYSDSDNPLKLKADFMFLSFVPKTTSHRQRDLNSFIRGFT